MQSHAIIAPNEGANTAAIASTEFKVELIRLFLAARPLTPPKSHHSKIVTLVGPHDFSLCPAGPRFQLQKTFRCANPAHHPLHPRGTWGSTCDPASGKWES
jgi:hypothetical protein